MKGKSDPIDAYATATAVLSARAAGRPKRRDGVVGAVRVPRTARRHQALGAETAELDAPTGPPAQEHHALPQVIRGPEVCPALASTPVTEIAQNHLAPAADSSRSIPRTENPMSIKLYDGMRLTAYAPDLFELTRMISKRMREVFRELAVRIIARNVARVVDDAEVRERDMGGPLHNCLVYRARKLWLDEQAGLDDRVTFHDPLHFSIVFGQVADECGTRRLAYPFSGNRAYTHALMALEANGRPLFVDYHYQNQGDRPKEIRKDEWKRRRDDWNRLLGAGDRETDGTLGHLPGWQLPDSIEGVFDAVLRGYKDTIDLNVHCTVEDRMRRTLNRAVTLYLGLDEVNGIGRVLTRNRRIERATELYLSTAHGAVIPRPALLPDTRDLGIAISKLPPVYQPPAGAVARISELYREQALAGD
ncbi:hypothetical protein [Streptomyces sp. NPDC059788]|uniref:hypothetical protein n=1 Tax=Streptomyces sp. NPDC059788 TaxID=3346948 RepID=UPI0036523F8D